DLLNRLRPAIRQLSQRASIRPNDRAESGRGPSGTASAGERSPRLAPADNSTPGRTSGRPGLYAGVLRFKTGSRLRRHRMPGGRRLGRTVLRLPLLELFPAAAARY